LLWLFGPDFTTAYPVMFALAVGLLLRAWAGPAQCLLVVGGRQKAAAAVLMLAVIVNVVLNVLLIPQLGILGAAIATAAAFSFEAAINLILCNRFFPGTAHGPHAPAAG
jgi:O-antigen/teichoic acid export membrane protein